jgi:ABC-type sugar transport system ATPase subunit
MASSTQMNAGSAGPIVHAPVIELADVSKNFGPTRAIIDASMTILPGEVHAIVGENGSGKSTLVKILSGVHHPDGGSFVLRGAPTAFATSPRAAQASGIATVFQEVLTVDSRTVLENIWLGLESIGNRVPLREKRHRAQAVLDELLDVPPSLDVEVGELSLSDRQACSIARAIIRDPDVLILDEATSALDYSTRSRLFSIVKRLGAGGTATVLITHRMDEIEEIGDRITVMRSGETVGTLRRGEWSPETLVRMMTGSDHLVEREARSTTETRSAATTAVLEVHDLVLRDGAAPITLSIHAGEVIGVAGLEGHGQDEFVKALAGIADRPGTIERIDADGRRRAVSSHRVASRLGIAYVPRERRAESIFEWMPILENFAMPTYAEDARAGFVSHRRSAERLEKYVDLLKIKLGRTTDAITTLSGGNQQKVIIARWLASSPTVLVLNDPTRGIDINAKRDLYALLDTLSAEGLAVVMLSTEVDEHVELMDRVLVFREGSMTAQIPRARLDRDVLVASYFGDDQEVQA